MTVLLLNNGEGGRILLGREREMKWKRNCRRKAGGLRVAYIGVLVDSRCK